MGILAGIWTIGSSGRVLYDKESAREARVRTLPEERQGGWTGDGKGKRKSGTQKAARNDRDGCRGSRRSRRSSSGSNTSRRQLHSQSQ